MDVNLEYRCDLRASASKISRLLRDTFYYTFSGSNILADNLNRRSICDSHFDIKQGKTSRIFISIYVIVLQQT